MFAVDCVVGAGGGPPPRRHLTEDELFYIFEGAISFPTVKETRRVSAGESVYVPRKPSNLIATSAARPRG